MSADTPQPAARRTLLGRLCSVVLALPFLGRAQVLEAAEDLSQAPTPAPAKASSTVAIQTPRQSVPRRH